MLQYEKVLKGIISLLFCLLQFVVFAQEVEPQITATRIFIAKGLHEAMPRLQSIGLETLAASDIEGNVRVAIYNNEIYDPSNPNASFLYGFEGDPTVEAMRQNNSYVLEDPKRRKWWSASDFKALLDTDPIEYYTTQFSSNAPAIFRRTVWAFFKNYIASWSGGANSGGDNNFSEQSEQFPMEYRAEVTFREGQQENMNVHLGGIGGGTIQGEDLDPNYPDLQVFVYRNGALVGGANAFRLNPQPGQPPNPKLNLVLGDSVVFRTKHPHFNFPDLPEVWIARSAGESLYYCTKEQNLLQYIPDKSKNGKLLNSLSIRNKYAPFIGFDFQDGAFITRGYADPHHISQPIATKTPKGEQEWYWIAQRRMDAAVTDFSDDTNVVFDIAKDKTRFTTNKLKYFQYHFMYNSTIHSHITNLAVDISKIRNNKREGFNRRQLFDLKPMGEGYEDDFFNFTLGFDGNEFFSRESTRYSAMAVKNNYWKGLYPLIPEGFHPNLPVFNAILKNRNKKIGWSTIDLFVSQYLTHQLLRDPNSNYSKLVRAGQLAFDYRGYEIQDKYTYLILNNTPFDACNGKPCVRYDASAAKIFSNVKAPGKITFKFTDIDNTTKQFPLSVNISSPLPHDKGFYGGLEGEQWPSVGQKNVPYTFTGLKGISAAKRQRLVMEYTHENHLGILKRVTRPFNPENYNSKGKWTEKFDIESTIGYNEITVYYKTSNNPGASKVIIAGKELLEIELRHVSVPGSRASFVDPSGILPGLNLREGKGEASKTYLTDLVEQSENYGPEFGDLPDGVFKRYVFSQGDEATFVAMDGAPHTFFHYDEEWELSERTMAKRMYPDDLANRIQWCLVLEGSDLPAHVQSGQKFNYTFDTPGKYRLTARYNECSALTVEVLVKSAPDIDTNEAAKGEITLYPLTPRQREILMMAHPETNISNSLKVAKLENVFSAFEAKNTWNELTYNNDFRKVKEFKWLFDKEYKPLDLEIIQDITLPGKYVITGFLEDDLNSENTEFEIPYAHMQGILSDHFVEPYQARFPFEKRYSNIWLHKGFKHKTAQDLARKYRIKSKGMVTFDKLNFFNHLGDFSGVFFGENQGLQQYGTEENYQQAVTESAFPPHYDPLEALFLNDFSTGRKALLDPMATRGKALEVAELIRSIDENYLLIVAELKAEAPSAALIHLEFENNLDDTSGNNVQSTSASPVYLTYQPTQKKHAVGITQNPSKIQVDVNASYVKTEYTERTVAFWFRTTNHANNVNANKFILDHGNATDGIALRINQTQNKVEAGFRNNATLKFLSVPFELMTWHHVALVFNKGEYQLYFDGSAIGTVSHSNFNEQQVISEDMWIGGNSSETAFGNATVGSFRGMVDDYYMYDKALSLTEINQLIMSAVPDGTSGSQHKSKTKISLKKGVELVVLYPNPTAKNKALTLETHLEKAETITYSITDISGKTLVSKSIELSAGTTKTPLKISGLKAGVYIVKIKGNKLHSTHKIVVD